MVPNQKWLNMKFVFSFLIFIFGLNAKAEGEKVNLQFHQLKNNIYVVEDVDHYNSNTLVVKMKSK